MLCALLLPSVLLVTVHTAVQPSVVWSVAFLSFSCLGSFIVCSSQHRLPEHHNCTHLEDCRQQAFERNKSKLESERTVASKMTAA